MSTAIPSQVAVNFVEIWNAADSVEQVCGQTGQNRTAAHAMANRLRRKGRVLKPLIWDRSGANNPRWKGGKRTRRDGYVIVYSPGHPCAYRNFVLEHRLVMEAHLGRYLKSNELVHHINEIRNDNRIENLRLEVRSSHAIVHFKGRTFKRWKPLVIKEEIEELYCRRGLTIRDAAKVLGMSYGALRRHLIEFGVPIRKKDPWWKRKNKAANIR